MFRMHRSCCTAASWSSQVKTSRVFLRDCTPVSPLSLLLLGGPLTVIHDRGVVLVSGWIRIVADAATAVRIRQLRGALDSVLAERVRRPDLDLAGIQEQVVGTIVSMLTQEAANSQKALMPETSLGGAGKASGKQQGGIPAQGRGNDARGFVVDGGRGGGGGSEVRGRGGRRSQTDR